MLKEHINKYNIVMNWNFLKGKKSKVELDINKNIIFQKGKHKKSTSGKDVEYRMMIKIKN